MQRPKCMVKNCNNGALMLFGNKWICGECFIKINNREIEKKNKLVEELGEEK